MSKIRLQKDVTGHYSSFEDLAKDFGLAPATRRTKDAEKLKSQRDKLAGKCKVCGSVLEHVSSTNVFVCKNEKCKGIKISRTDRDGEDKSIYVPVVKIMDGLGSKIVENLFD